MVNTKIRLIIFFAAKDGEPLYSLQKQDWEVTVAPYCQIQTEIVTPYMAAHQAPPSLGFSRQEHWSGLPFPSPMRESEQ